ncbi:MAG: hypothetical protein N3E41_05915 [Thermofilaceae archaeon]|nr:hypothetical protein [Thermofilaceae archaeon]
MGKVVVSAKIERELYEKVKKYRIPVSVVIRRALEEEVARVEEKEVEVALEKAGRILEKVPRGEFVEVVRSSREER